MSERKVYKMKKEDKPYSCDECGKTFSQERYLKQHLQRKNACTTKFNCTKCGKEFTNASNLKIHENRATSCIIEEIPVISTNNTENKCHICGNTYSTLSSLKRHQREVCSNDQSKIDQLITLVMEQNKLIIDERQQDRQQIMQLQQHLIDNGIAPMTNNNNITNNVQQQNNLYMNVNIIPFGDEDYSKLDHVKVMDLVQNHTADFVPKMIEQIYANPNMPAYHNVFYDKRHKMAIKFAAVSANTKSWVTTDAKEVSDQITSKLQKYMHPLNSPYFNMAMKYRDTETANKIINLSNPGDDTFDKNIEALAILPKNKNFMDKVQESASTE